MNNSNEALKEKAQERAIWPVVANQPILGFNTKEEALGIELVGAHRSAIELQSVTEYFQGQNGQNRHVNKRTLNSAN